MISVSVIIITQGRAELLMKCLSSLQQLPKEMELILVSNGEAIDEKIREYVEKSFSKKKIVETPQVLSPGEARNLAIKESSDSEWLLFLDDDAYLSPNYWEVAQRYIVQKETDVLGGPDMAPSDMGYFSRAVATVLTSPFCTGLTFSRHFPLGKKIQFASEENLTSANLWVRRKLFESVDFPTLYKRGEESLVLAKFAEMGFGMFYHPKLRIYHYRRNSLSEVLKVNFKGGYYRSQMMKEKVDLSWSYYLPSAFILLHFTAFYDFKTFLELVVIYLSLIACISLGISQRQGNFATAPMVFILHYLIVVTYGLGFMWGRLHKMPKSS
ncbi:MAG: glycosyltransferase [Bacteriovoracaceae bacterium]